MAEACSPSAIWYNQYPDLERVSSYCKGGYHSVNMGDIFNNRYRVVGKLGYGAYGTVWLVEDMPLKRFASLKVLAAYASTASRETEVIRYLRAQQQRTPSAAGVEYVMKVFDDFKIEGPNGTHECIVTELLGPYVDPTDLEEVYDDERFPLDVRKKMVSQIARGVAYLHKCGVVHGDLHLGNMLLYHPRMAHFSLEDIRQYFEIDEGGPLTRVDGVPITPTAHVPQRLYTTPLPYALLRLCLSSLETVHVKICDFGEAFLYAVNGTPQPNTTTPIPRHIPRVYAAPEIIFEEPINPAPPSDIWALAVLMHMILSIGGYNMPFHSDYGITKELVREMVRSLGKLPQRWWTRWAERREYFDENGVFLGDRKGLISLVHLSPRDGTSEEDVRVFEHLLRKMLCYEMKDRISADEVVRLIPAAWMGCM
ncbi:kinase-like domain-containing protein [Lyophyllum atratum]|nr:kinase-like domain-containing protein [Lyophyllum atratum]